MRGMTLPAKRELADKVLRFLADTHERSWPNTHNIMQRAADSIGVELFEVWKAYDLLRLLGRVELINPNGQRGLRLLDTTPLTMPGITVEHRDNAVVVTGIIHDLYKRYPDEVWAAVTSLPKKAQL